MECRDRGIGKPTVVYTDVPTRTVVLPGGLVEPEKECNLFIHWATTRLDNPPNPSALSIRWVANGVRYLDTDNLRYAVDAEHYHLFNAGQCMSSTIRSRMPVECFNVSFDGNFASETLRALITPADKLLDAPKGAWPMPLQFMDRLYPHDEIVSPALFELQRMAGTPEADYGWFEEQFHCLLERMLQAHRNVCQQVERMPAARASTRAELYRRLHHARDFMESSLGKPITIEEIAEAAYFSPHHFLRLFKKVFQETPHQYLMRRRMELASRLLLRSDESVTSICQDVGFESLGSFSWLFRRTYGISPEGFRRQNRPFIT